MNSKRKEDEIENRLHYLQQQIDAQWAKLDMLLDHLNLSISKQERWFVDKKRPSIWRMYWP